MSEAAEAAQDTNTTDASEFKGLPSPIDAPPDTDTESQQGTPEDHLEPQRATSKPPGYYPIDVESASKEEVAQRLNYMFRQIKDNERYRHKADKVMADQSKMLDEIVNGMGVVASHLQDKTFNETEAQFMQEMQAAHESGDTRAYMAAQSKLINLGVQKELAVQQRKLAPNQEEKQAEADQPVFDESAISPSTRAWQEERDERGNHLRPWTQPIHPRYQQAFAELMAIKRNPSMANASEEQVMAEVDRRMGVNKQSPKQTVMGGALTGSRKMSKITLTPELEKLAIRTKFGGPKAKSPADHIEAYVKQMEQVRSQKGART